MEYIVNSEEYVRPNFKYSEFYSKSYDAPEEHPLSSKVMNAWQLIRDYYQKPIRITSTYRTFAGNFSAGGSSTSQHLTGHAIDGEFLEDEQATMQAFYSDMICKGALYQALRQTGIKGIGIYNGFIHLDDGESPLNPRAQFTAWDGTDGRFGEINFTTSYMADVPENGAPWCAGTMLLSIPTEIEKHTSKAKGLLQELFSWNQEEGILWNQTQKVALFIVILFAFYLIINKKK